MLKADFHTHTSDDPLDEIDHSAEMLIDAVAARGFDVLAISNHTVMTYDAYLAAYARARGVLLVPAIEADIEGRHVVILNPSTQHIAAQTFADLRRIGRGDAAVIAPHPYYPANTALRRKLAENIDCFDAIEYCAFYLPGLNFPNKKACEVAERHALPMVGNSDTHVFPYVDSTYTWVECESTIESVVEAVRRGKVRVETRPRPIGHVASMLRFSIAQSARDIRKAAQRREWVS